MLSRPAASAADVQRLHRTVPPKQEPIPHPPLPYLLSKRYVGTLRNHPSEKPIAMPVQKSKVSAPLINCATENPLDLF